MLPKVRVNKALIIEATVTHQFLKSLLLNKKLLRNYTQNIDTLDDLMRTGPRGTIRLEDKTIYLHGSIKHYRCSINEGHFGISDTNIITFWKQGTKVECHECFPFNKFGRRISTGILLPDIDLYNSVQPNNRTEKIGEAVASDIRLSDCFIVMGTSLRKDVKVYYIRRMSGIFT
jgi:NAD-dependent SIR2 family protein deacetylase